MFVDGVKVIADPILTHEEIVLFVAEEKHLWESKNKKLGRLELGLDGEEVIVKATEKSPIRRVRRITGYLSSIDNFNEAKVAECTDRAKHSLQ
ncbi:MAG: anaerobic ribonucleoside-triphosphate reductase [Negativicutes bacterium]